MKVPVSKSMQPGCIMPISRKLFKKQSLSTQRALLGGHLYGGTHNVPGLVAPEDPFTGKSSVWLREYSCLEARKRLKQCNTGDVIIPVFTGRTPAKDRAILAFMRRPSIFRRLFSLFRKESI